MGQKINPISNRLGIVRGWDSNWFGGKNYGDTILEYCITIVLTAEPVGIPTANDT